MERCSFTISKENDKKLRNYVKNWARGPYKDNLSAFLNHVIERYVPEDPSTI